MYFYTENEKLNVSHWSNLLTKFFTKFHKFSLNERIYNVILKGFLGPFVLYF